MATVSLEHFSQLMLTGYEGTITDLMIDLS